MNNEIKRLEMRIKLGSGDEELDLVQSAALRDLIDIYESQIAVITEKNNQLHDEAQVADSLVLTLQEEVKMLAKERDAARKELAELRSAPGMEEVGVLHDQCFDGADHTFCSHAAVISLAVIARRAIVSREKEKQRADEIEGLLKWLTEKSEDWDNFAFLVESDSTEHLGKVRRILEIVEGK